MIFITVYQATAYYLITTLIVINVKQFAFGAVSYTTLESSLKSIKSEWGPVQYCSPGAFVTGFRTKIHDMSVVPGMEIAIPGTSIGIVYPRAPMPDHSGLNGIQLYCSYDGKILEWLTSAIGPNGQWSKNVSSCFPHRAVGFMLKADQRRRSKDFLGATNFRLICDDSPDEIIQEESHPGTWVKPQMCQSNFGICGLQTQVDMLVGSGDGDATGLNNVRVICCPVFGTLLKVTTTKKPDYFGRSDLLTDQDNVMKGREKLENNTIGHESNENGTDRGREGLFRTLKDDDEVFRCIPMEIVEKIFEFDNTNGFITKSISLTRNIGVSRKTSHDLHIHKMKSSSSDLTGSVGGPFPPIAMLQLLSAKMEGKLAGVKNSMYNWGEGSDVTWSAPRTTSVSVSVPGGAKSEIYQVVGRCGPYEIRTDKFIPKDTMAPKMMAKHMEMNKGFKQLGETFLATLTKGDSMSLMPMMLGMMTLGPAFIMNLVLMVAVLSEILKLLQGFGNGNHTGRSTSQKSSEMELSTFPSVEKFDNFKK